LKQIEKFKFMNKLNFRDFDLAFVDCEMTGRNFEHELIEIAVVRVSAFNFAVLDEWSAKIKPQHTENAEPEALKITGYNEKDWLDALDEETALKIFLEKTDKAILVGQNISNDLLFIYKALAKYNLKPTFWYKSIDTFTLAWQKLRDNQDIKGLGLTELMGYFGLTRENAHSALDDAYTAYKVFLKLLEI